MPDLPLTVVFLETERLTLRRFTSDDVDALVELDSDAEVMHFLTGGRPTPRQEVETEVLPAFLSYYERFPGYGFWAVIEKATDEFIGWFHLRPAPGSSAEEPELGYRLRKAAWGKGFATEGSRALIKKGFEELGAERVVAGTLSVNARSRRVMEKLGMSLVGAVHHDEVEYAVTKAQWLESAPPRATGCGT